MEALVSITIVIGVFIGGALTVSLLPHKRFTVELETTYCPPELCVETTYQRYVLKDRETGLKYPFGISGDDSRGKEGYPSDRVLFSIDFQGHGPPKADGDYIYVQRSE